MSNKLRVGLVGADATGRGWGPVAHIPALRAIDDIELAAVGTSRPESAAAASEAYGVPGYHDIRELASQPDIDIVAVVVRVPFHHEIVMPALEAGKHVFCEWPLGANLPEAQEMAALARAQGVVTAVGLQGRHDPALTYIKELREEGWFGEIVSVNMTMLGSGAGRSDSRTAWMGDAKNGANFYTIAAGHSLDYVAHAVGPVSEISARVSTRVPQWHLADTDEVIDVDAPDTVVATGVLSDGGLVSIHAASVPFHGTNWRMKVFGTKGTILATTPVMPQITPVSLRGAQGGEPLTELRVPDHLQVAPSDVPDGPPHNVAGTYVRMATAIREGGGFQPDFDHAVELHTLLEGMQSS